MRSSLILPMTLFTCAALAGRAQATPSCTPSRMLMVVDKSSSMTATVDGTGKSKWQLAQEAITSLSNTYENKIDLGINIFPNPSQCAPGKTLVEPGPAHASAIIATLGAPPPASGNYTPMSQSIDVAANDVLLADPSRHPAILLITDGWQWCSPYDASTRTWPIDSVVAAKNQGIKVYVVGFGDSVDVVTMNKMAYAAGTSLPGCNPNNTTLTGNNCYYQVDSGAALMAALNTISTSVSAEVCDGLDNDCDGLIDEDLSRDCSTSCGSGSEVCTAGAWGGCSAPTPSAEVCDLVDNNCDGRVDEGCACTPGAMTACGGGGQGACAPAGTQTCLPNGQWSPCTGAGAPTSEICNGIDDDCDGIIDNGDNTGLCATGSFCGDNGTCQQSSGGGETYQSMPDGCEAQGAGCSCTPADKRSCTDLKGACAVGTGNQTCNAAGTWNKCLSAVAPTPDKCNGIDDDCDGIVDNGDPATLCPAGWSCGDGKCHNAAGETEQVAGCSIAGSKPLDRGGLILALWMLTGIVILARRRLARG